MIREPLTVALYIIKLRYSSRNPPPKKKGLKIEEDQSWSHVISKLLVWVSAIQQKCFQSNMNSYGTCSLFDTRLKICCVKTTEYYKKWGGVSTSKAVNYRFWSENWHDVNHRPQKEVYHSWLPSSQEWHQLLHNSKKVKL